MGIRIGRTHEITLKPNPTMAGVSFLTLFLTSFATFAAYVTNLLMTMPSSVVAGEASRLIATTVGLYLLVVAAVLYVIRALWLGNHAATH
jgi:UDP-3-O-acyl-N-acetylglucosamine deacetylase